MSERRYRVLYVLGHPVQYFSPVLRLLAEHPRLEVTTAYCRLHGAKAAHDPEFGAIVQWDVPVLDGYSWLEVPRSPGAPVIGRPGRLCRGQLRAAVPEACWICYSYNVPQRTHRGYRRGFLRYTVGLRTG